MAAAPSSPGSLSLQGVCPIHGRAGYRSSEAVGRPLDSLHQAAPTVAWTHPERVAPPGFPLALAGRGRSDARLTVRGPSCGQAGPTDAASPPDLPCCRGRDRSSLS